MSQVLHAFNLAEGRQLKTASQAVEKARSVLKFKKSVSSIAPINSIRYPGLYLCGKIFVPLCVEQIFRALVTP